MFSSGPVFVIDDGQGHVVVVAELAGHFALVHVVAHAHDALPLDFVADDDAGLREHEVAQGEHADELVLFIDDIAVIRAFHFELHLGADMRNGLVHGPGLLQHDDLGVHDTGGRIRREIQQIAEFF